MRYSTVTMIVTLLQLAIAGVAGAQSTTDLVHASLLANVSTINPGEPFTLGVLLNLKPGWHVYWTNPGDSGLPTRVQWFLPPGFTASELRFPVPERIDLPGGIVIFGYTDQVMLTATITPPVTRPVTPSAESAAAPTAFDIAAKVSWLCCSEDCVPGKTTLNIELTAGDKSVPANTPLFEQWQTRLPIPAPTPATPLVLSDPSPHTQVMTTRRITDPKAIIPGAVDGLLLTVGTPRLTATGTTIPLNAQILKGQTVTAKSVPILVTWADPDGNHRLGEELTVPIVSGR